MFSEAWRGFTEGSWNKAIDVRDFIQKNYTPYEGNESFLASPTERTKELWQVCNDLIVEELKKGVLDIDTENIAGVDNFAHKRTHL